MSKFKKVLSLTLLITICLYPASAFAASSKESYDDKKSLLSSIFSVFSVTKSNNNNGNNNSNHNNDKQNNNKNNNNNNNHSNQPDKNKNDKDWDKKDWFDWFDKDHWFDDDDWWDDICWWDKNKEDSHKIWERYYCY
ncbi:hypothetical protein [Bacillus sp. FJAT-28004]|uniref:hypothetical protein n=1 Tax=Bacillus sp. FJAT-28004 TaxID=1679165 RepID=UPI0006B45933|nr:hypothetical protein [Bacillus sp. FJAT-28004]